MKRYLKTIIGILLIASAAGAMYLWNEKGREQVRIAEEELRAAEEAKAEAEALRDPYEDVYLSGKSFFPVPKDWISTVSSKLSVDSIVDVYYKKDMVNENEDDKQAYEIVLFDKEEYIEYEADYYGSFKVSGVTDNEVEIICSLEEFTGLENLVKHEENKLLFVMRSSHD